ncbi:NRAMP family divalent metal transporter [Aestuariimicrobium kwangyangense]|uniref:NRAMP family divalent metal transporter n=1 Tax=Aestuariimicrobium kwangyangense TaxID=396389 RepID=UPI0003B350A1|nr:divalent metal cation transporter [Aestuariimicrobium kwangyangense]
MTRVEPSADIPESLEQGGNLAGEASPATAAPDRALPPSSSKPSGEPPSSPRPKTGPRAFLGVLGPGLVTGVADDDPSGVATYSQAGAALGVGMLWTAPASLPLMYAVQEICDRTALATGDSLGTLVRRRFPTAARWVVGVLVVALIVANCLNVAADLAAIGSGMELLHAGRDHVWAAVAGAGLTAALAWGSFERLAKVFKWLCLVLFAYVGVLFVANVRWGAVAAGTLGLRMTWNWTSIGLVVAVLGTTISPYMFFWQSGHRVEEMRAESDTTHASQPLPQRPRKAALRNLFLARIDVFVGMLVSTAAMFAIMVSTASTIGRNGPATIKTASDAAAALAPIAGQSASIIFAIGFVSTGVLAVPVLASSGSIALAGLLGKPWGFDLSVRRAPVFYSLIGAGTVGGIAISYFSDNPVSLLVLSATINGIAAAPFLVVVMLISNSRTLMGQYRNGRLSTFFGWFTVAVMTAAGLAGLYVTIWNPH